MFDKTLDAAISKGAEIDNSFDALDQKVEDAKKSIINEAISELGQAGSREREKIESIVNSQLSRLEEDISSTRELTENYISKNDRVHIIDNPYIPHIIDILAKVDSEVNMRDLAAMTNLPYSHVKKTVYNLVKKGIISVTPNETGFAKYKLTKSLAA